MLHLYSGDFGQGTRKGYLYHITNGVSYLAYGRSTLADGKARQEDEHMVR
jgi:hypothetical protein